MPDPTPTETAVRDLADRWDADAATTADPRSRSLIRAAAAELRDVIDVPRPRRSTP